MLTGPQVFKRHARPFALSLAVSWLFCLVMAAHMSAMVLMPADLQPTETTVSHAHQAPGDEAASDCCESQMTVVPLNALSDLLADTFLAVVLFLLLWVLLRARSLPLAVPFSPPDPGGQRRHLLFCNFRH